MLKTKTAKELGPFGALLLATPWPMCSPAGAAAACWNSPTGAPSRRSISAASRASSTSRLSNALNSGIRRIAVATQYKAHSLIRHLQRGWNFFRPERNESFDILPASQRVSETMWYLGHRRRGLSEHRHHRELRPAVHGRAGRRSHLQDGLREDAAAARRLGRRRDGRLPRGLARGGQGLRRHACRRRRTRIIEFLEKPKNPPPMPGKPDVALCSMGIYVFETTFLIDLLKRDAADPNSSHDFGKDIIPYIVKNGKAVAHHFSQSCVTLDRGGQALLARRRNGRRLLGRQYRSDRHRARSRPLRPQLADLDLWRDHPAGEIRA